MDTTSILACLAVLVLVGSVLAGVVGNAPLIAAQGALPIVGLAAPVALALAVPRRRRLPTAVALVASIAFVAVLLPEAVGAQRPSWVDGAETFSVYAANVRYDSDRQTDVAEAVLAADADVVVLNEITPSQRAALRAAGADDLYPHQVHSDDSDLYGEMILSRLDTVDIREEWRDPLATPAVTVAVGGSAVRIYAIHLQSPDDPGGRRPWLEQFDILGGLPAEAETELVLAGDFNASPFHSPFRDLLDHGLIDAHRATGQGLSTSWAPNGGPSLLAGRLMRLDHSLSTEAVQPVEVIDADVPGSDHRSLRVTYAVRS